ncbi:Maf family protein [Alkaliphilus oremlandii]|uniref:dTTP/UTP pyrophosphatase n=1 Tax=Alkaliphilus oremlandii (strain OhILAs) TaxID=350688 RepID=NTPPA_ALKOO|nr:Maf family protein [Alkaliphilus oremlandii]A8MHM5.1 RecName: Full=dTTP/UTP pyrophosphatase; Short=dTTPase/UTPase; AltName: Full=Nucleoside triphosphate pyrophosphatase; AltName: Full=Nucleotide pyrophosphatase; Short=Nucleotide PPase [Alkaliphilus oremlandii OhILAs]ABW19307.1 maf protein [Alkaliphilus oremlandii OhILAs]
MKQMILASASPRRRELLQGLGVPFEVMSSDIEEKINTELSAPEIAKELAYQKAKDVSNKLDGDYIVIGADTIVEYNRILGKPKDADEAYQMLKLLSGKIHRVITGFAVIDCRTKKEIVDFEVTNVYFNHLSDEEINRYIETKEPMDKAGAYGIQGKASLFVSKIEGDYFNVVGLPIFKLGVVLRNHFDINLL